MSRLHGASTLRGASGRGVSPPMTLRRSSIRHPRLAAAVSTLRDHVGTGETVTDKLSQTDRQVRAVEPDPIGQHWEYGDWVDLLGAHFFTPERAGAPVTFFVDED